MLTALLLAGAMHLASPTVFREPPPVPPTTKKDFQIGGGFVLECTYSWSEWKQDGGSGMDYCNHVGVRKVHASHLACTDGTCHQECSRTHNAYGHDYDVVIEEDPGFADSMKKWAQALDKSNGMLGAILYDSVSMAPVVRDFRESVLGEMSKVREYSPYLGEHFANSCEGVDRWMDYVRSECTLTYRLRAATLGYIYQEDSCHVGSLKTVGRGYLRRNLYCKCDPTTIPDKPVRETALTFPNSTSDPTSPEYAGIWTDDDGDGSYVQIALADASRFGIEFRSDGMTSYQVSCRKGDEMPVGIIIVPGFALDSSDPKVQDLMICGGVKLAPRSGTITGKGRAACLEMKKSEPTMATSFKPVAAPSPELVPLALYHANTRISGPWDQARTWMVTDGASYDQIARLLRPMITPGRFVKELETLGNMRLSPSNPKMKAVFDPEFAKNAALTDTERASYVQKAWTADPERCRNWLRQQPGLAEPAARAFFAEGMHADPAATANLLAERSRKLPKGEFAKQGGWDLLGTALFGSDAKAADTAIKAMESAPDRAQLWFVLNANGKLPAPIRDRAAKLAATLDRPVAG